MSVLSVADAKSHLNITGATSDAELQGFIDTAESVIAERCGPLEPTSVVETIRAGYRGKILLKVAPVISLTSIVTTGGQAIDAASLYVSESGVLSYVDGYTWFGGSTYVVSYEAGRSSLPAALLMAVKEEVRHLWKTQRGASTRTGDPQAAAAGYLVPYLVAELIEPYRMNLGSS